MWFVLGGILIIVAIIAFCMRTFSTQKRLDQLTRSSRQKLGEILAAYRETKKDLGELGEENSAAEELTVMGMPKCAQPLISPLGQKECIYYEMSVTAERIEHYQERDSDGNMRDKTRRITDTLDASSNSTRFELDDGTDTVTVEPRGGVFEDLVTTVERSETAFNQNSNSLSFGGFTLNFSNFNQYRGGMRPETIKYRERIIGLDRKITVVGTLCDKMGDLMIENSDKGKVIISTKSPAEMIKSTQKDMQTQLLVAAICGGLGIVACILGVVFSLNG